MTTAMALDAIQAMRRYRVLLADDDDGMRWLVSARLREAGHEVVETADGHALVACLEEAARDDALGYDVVLADVELSGPGGLDVLAGLGCVHWETPFVVMATRATPEVRATARVLGAVTVLEKPIAQTELEAALRAAVRSRRLAGGRPVLVLGHA
jgi:two-component system nitrogen regulation response regulator GlnG